MFNNKSECFTKIDKLFAYCELLTCDKDIYYIDKEYRKFLKTSHSYYETVIRAICARYFDVILFEWLTKKLKTVMLK